MLLILMDLIKKLSFNMTDELYFLTRYTPFWAIPIMLISLECAYLFWIRKKKKYVIISLITSALTLFSVCFYYWSGGPDKSVQEVKKSVRFLKE